MKLFLSLLTVFMFSQISLAQNDVQNQLIGRWDAIYTENGKSSSDVLIQKTKEASVESKGNHNILVINFGKDGGFDLMSIRDYSQATEEGTFEVSEDGSKITRNTKMPSSLKEKFRTSSKKRKAKILYLEGDVLVLKIKKEVIYLKRT